MKSKLLGCAASTLFVGIIGFANFSFAAPNSICGELKATIAAAKWELRVQQNIVRDQLKVRKRYMATYIRRVNAIRGKIAQKATDPTIDADIRLRCQKSELTAKNEATYAQERAQRAGNKAMARIEAQRKRRFQQVQQQRARIVREGIKDMLMGKKTLDDVASEVTGDLTQCKDYFLNQMEKAVRKTKDAIEGYIEGAIDTVIDAAGEAGREILTGVVGEDASNTVCQIMGGGCQDKPKRTYSLLPDLCGTGDLSLGGPTGTDPFADLLEKVFPPN